ncbi:MAG: DNA repair protein RadC [Luteitalea sp.]|nr:DNA repair protein RadC [Luteitalea sp.]
MKRLAQEDRPREKLDRLGPTALGDNELLAIVVGHGIGRLDALEVADRLLAEVEGLHGLARASRDDLDRVPGVGATKAARLLAAIELGRRTLTRAAPERPQLATPRETAAYLLPRFGGHRVEQFGIVMVDTKHRVLKATAVSRGTLDGSLVHPREVFREAVLRGAAAIVLFHNHPSGDPSPSRDDVKLTRRLLMAGDVMGIDVLDHVILGDTTYFSFREAGQI